MNHAFVSWLRLFMHWMPWVCCLAFDNAGNSMAARIAMIAMTTSNSMRVNPPLAFISKLYAFFFGCHDKTDGSKILLYNEFSQGERCHVAAPWWWLASDH